MFRLHKNSFVVLSAWLSAILAAILFFVPFRDNITPFLLWLSLSLGICAFLYLHSKTVRLEVKPRELFIHRGFIFIQEKRIPVRYITSLYFFQSPLQRILGQCVLVICTSGSFSFFIGFSKDDACILYEQLYPQGGN